MSKNMNLTIRKSLLNKHRSKNMKKNPIATTHNMSKNKKDTSQAEQVYKIKFTASLFGCIGLAFYYGTEHNLNYYQISSIVMMIFMIHFLVTLFNILRQADNLYYIKVERNRVSMTPALFITSALQSRYNEPIPTISDLLAIGGSNLDKIASSTIYIATSIAANSALSSSMTHGLSYDKIAILWCCASLWMIQTFPHYGHLMNRAEFGISELLHVIGVIGSFGGAFIAFTLQQQFSTQCGVFAVVVILLCIIFGIVNSIHNPQMVYYQSLASIGTESLMFFTLSLMGSMYTYNLE